MKNKEPWIRTRYGKVRYNVGERLAEESGGEYLGDKVEYHPRFSLLWHQLESIRNILIDRIINNFPT